VAQIDTLQHAVIEAGCTNKTLAARLPIGAKYLSCIMHGSPTSPPTAHAILRELNRTLKPKLRFADLFVVEEVRDP